MKREIMPTLLEKKSLSGQSGKSLFSWLLTLFIVGFLAQSAIKISPAYLDSYYIKEILISLSSDTELSEMSPSEVQEKITKSLDINNIDGEPLSALKVRRVDGNIVIDIDYEKRIGFFANIDIVLSFEHHLDSSVPNECCRPQ
jgi:hypothetical protein